MQAVLFSLDYFSELQSLIEVAKCSWKGSHVETYLSIDVPKDVDYQNFKRQLELGIQQQKWDFKEACLSDEHRVSL